MDTSIKQLLSADAALEFHHSTPLHRRSWVVESCIVSFGGAILIFGLVFITFNTFDPTNTDVLTEQKQAFHHNKGMSLSLDTSSANANCGTSVEAARSMACIYDMMAQAWIPASCYQPTISEKYLALSNWTYWTPSTSTPDLGLAEGARGGFLQLSALEVAKGTYKFLWTTNEFHVAHCLYAWELYMNAAEKVVAVDTQAHGTHHAAHCSRFAFLVASGDYDKDAIQTEIKVGFHECSMP